MKLEFESKEELRKCIWDMFEQYTCDVKLVDECIEKIPERAFCADTIAEDKIILADEMKSNLRDNFINEVVEVVAMPLQLPSSPQAKAYVDVNNMSWEEIAAARDAWINGKKIELNDSALPPVKSKWA